MELINENNKNYFNPTSKIKSSPDPILFIPFNNEKHKCSICENKYSVTLLYKQKYCKSCLLSYIKNIKNLTNNEIYLDVHILTNNTQCIQHETTRNTRYIQEWCENCSEISYFKSYFYNNINNINTTAQNKNLIKETCELCENLIYRISFEFCSYCYLISSGWIKSNLNKTYIPIIYLPWWDASNKSRICNHNLKFISDCQKWCSDCFIFYVGCRF